MDGHGTQKRQGNSEIEKRRKKSIKSGSHEGKKTKKL